METSLKSNYDVGGKVDCLAETYICMRRARMYFKRPVRLRNFTVIRSKKVSVDADGIELKVLTTNIQAVKVHSVSYY